MTYERIFDLKFKENVTTHELGKRFPRERKKISRIALLELPFSMLRNLIKRETELKKLMFLRSWLLGKPKNYRAR